LPAGKRIVILERQVSERRKVMIGACAGDIIGSIYEGHPHKSKDFPLFGRGVRFTDDTILTVATAAALLGEETADSGRESTPAGKSDSGSDEKSVWAPVRRSREEYARIYKSYGREHPGRGYGGGFRRWLRADSLEPYGSFGNGSAMRVSPVGAALSDEKALLEEAERSAAASHDHPEGVKGAQAIALSVYLARRGASREQIRTEIEERFDYDLQAHVGELRPVYSFNPTCQGSVPESIVCFLDSTDWEDAVRNAVSLGGDADTMADMAGAIAEAFYGGVPEPVRRRVEQILDPRLRNVLERFYERFGLPLDAESGDNAPGANS
jgi:ADP-ribosylglycohydrolase